MRKLKKFAKKWLKEFGYDGNLKPRKAAEGGHEGADDEGGDSALAIAFGGAASATGDDTVAKAKLKGTVVTKKDVTIGYGKAKFKAFAEADGDGVVSTDAFAVGEAIGADFLVTINRSVDKRVEFENKTISFSKEVVKLVAIDFHDFDSPFGPVHFDIYRSKTAELEVRTYVGGDLIEGNLAEATAQFDAFGPNSFTDTVVSATTVEALLSVVTASGVAAADGAVA